MKRTALLLGAAMALGFPQHGYAGTETILAPGDQAPGAPAGAVHRNSNLPTLNDAGDVVFRGFLLPGVGGVDSTNETVIWRNGTIVAREGDEAFRPPTGAVFDLIEAPALNGAGQVVFEAFLRQGAGGVTFRNDNGLWVDSTLLVNEGQQAGDTAAGALFSGFSAPAINDASQVAFIATLETGGGGVNSGNDVGIWRDTTLIVREGNAAFDIFGGAVFSSFASPRINNLGQVAYWGAMLTNVGGVGLDNNTGLWLDTGLIAREGSQAGGVPGGAVFDSISTTPLLNDAGQVLYTARLREGFGGVDSTNENGIWRDSTLIAREGSQAGGLPAGAVYSNFGDPVLNNTGQVAFGASLRTGAGGVDSINRFGVWRDSTLIARSGNQAPDTGGAIFSGFSDVAINEAGQVLYEAFLLEGLGGVESTIESGLWITGTNGESLRVARVGDTLAGRTVTGVSIATGTGTSDDRGNSINSFSQVAFRANFGQSGDSGIFLYTPDLHWTRTSSSSWDTADNWTIGQLPGDPHDVFIDPDVSLTVTGPSGDVTLTHLTIGGGNGIATLSLNGGTITPDNAVVVTDTGVFTGDGAINGAVTNHGTVLADNLTLGGILTNHNLIAGNGRINGAVTNGGRIEAIGTSSAPVEIRFDGVVKNSAGVGLIVSRNAALRFNGGLTNNGALAVSFGTSDLFGDISNRPGGTIVLSGGSSTTFYDDVTNDGSIVVASAGPFVSAAVFFGDVSGAGSITGGGSVFLHGDLRPGNSPAAVNHDVELFLMSTVSTQIELGGTTPGSEHDQINNAKSTTLGGTLDVQLINGFDPEAGDTFDIFNFASQSGTFSDIVLPTLDAGLGWHLGELYAAGELHVELLGDLNLDGFVGAADLDLLLANWGDSALAFDYAAGDASGDGVVGDADLQLVLNHFGNGTDPGGVVPEPGSLALLALGGLALLKRRR